jgi:rubredoxin
MSREWECIECGYIEEGIRAPLRCPECGALKNHFQLLDMLEEDEDEVLADLDDFGDEEEEDEDLDADEEDEDDLFDDDEDY